MTLPRMTLPRAARCPGPATARPTATRTLEPTA